MKMTFGTLIRAFNPYDLWPLMLFAYNKYVNEELLICLVYAVWVLYIFFFYDWNWVFEIVQ